MMVTLTIGKTFGTTRGLTMTKEEIQAMIDLSIAKAMKKHNQTASVISACIGTFLLIFYAHGVWMIAH